MSPVSQRAIASGGYSPICISCAMAAVKTCEAKMAENPMLPGAVEELRQFWKRK